MVHFSSPDDSLPFLSSLRYFYLLTWQTTSTAVVPTNKYASEYTSSKGVLTVTKITIIFEFDNLPKKTPSKDPKTKDFNKLIEIFKKLADQATIESAIETIQYCNFVKKIREKDGRLIPVSIENELNRAIGDIVGELAVSSGTKFETAAKTFEKVTGIKADITQSKYYNR